MPTTPVSHDTIIYISDHINTENTIQPGRTAITKENLAIKTKNNGTPPMSHRNSFTKENANTKHKTPTSTSCRNSITKENLNINKIRNSSTHDSMNSKAYSDNEGRNNGRRNSVKQNFLGRKTGGEEPSSRCDSSISMHNLNDVLEKYEERGKKKT